MAHPFTVSFQGERACVCYRYIMRTVLLRQPGGVRVPCIGGLSIPIYMCLNRPILLLQGLRNPTSLNSILVSEGAGGWGSQEQIAGGLGVAVQVRTFPGHAGTGAAGCRHNAALMRIDAQGQVHRHE